MSNEPANDRQYTEKEIQVILKRAGELQAIRAKDPSEAGGTTLAQLQQAAAEIGIDADLIAQAAQGLTPAEDAGKSSLLAGGPWKVDFDQIVTGEVTEENWPFVVDEMRAATGRVGIPKAVGKGFEWLSAQPDPLHVTFTPAGDKTRVRVTARFGDWRLVFYVAPALFALMLTAVVGGALRSSGVLPPDLFLALLLGVPAVTVVGGRMAFTRFCAQRRRQTYQFIDRLKQAMTQPSPQNIVSAPEAVETASTPPSVSSQLSITSEEPLPNVQRLQN